MAPVASAEGSFIGLLIGCGNLLHAVTAVAKSQRYDVHEMLWFFVAFCGIVWYSGILVVKYSLWQSVACCGVVAPVA